MNFRILSIIAAFFLVLAAVRPGVPAATLLPLGEQCFSANTPTSGGNTGVITALATISAGGSGYATGTYTNVPLTGGSGSGATATVIVAGGAVTAINLTNPGTHYAPADNLSVAAANVGGAGSGFVVPVASVQGTGTGLIGLLGPITGGSAYSTGTYGGVALTGGSGSGATANITVSGGAVTAVAILNPGTQYVVGDVLSANAAAIGGSGSGFSVAVSSITINSSLAGGSVGYYIPSTNSFKQTWQNSGQTILNTNPVQLDANGCAIVYGTGTYRQILKDALGNTVWDQLTTDTSANNNTFWAGLAGGTANAITVVDTGFNGTDGSIIQFIPLLTNTGPATFNPSNYFGGAPPPIVKDTTAGAVALTGGEIVANSPSNVVSLVYSATQVNFHILNLIEPATVNTPPLCGASGLKVTNGSPASSQIIITARNLIMVSSAGQFINRSNVSLTIAITLGTSVSTVNGMDGEAPGTSNWIDVFAVDNGASVGTTSGGLGSLASGNGLSPQLPSGYAYSCYLGAMFVNSSGNLQGSIQLGNKAQWVVGGSGLTNGSSLVMASGVAGTYSTTSPVLASVPIAGFVPPTGTAINGALTNDWKSGGANGSAALAAPNSSWGGANNGPFGSNGNVWSAFVLQNVTFPQIISFNFILEGSGSIWWASNNGANAIAALGWTDAVNAN